MKSLFAFEITQTTNVMLYKISQGQGRRWTIDGNLESSEFKLRDIKRPENFIIVTKAPSKMTITTVSGYVYEITDKKGDGAKVIFHGAVNGLLVQGLLPRMTYVSGTLKGKTEDMDEFVSIDEFMETRQKRYDELGTQNPQDKHGWKVNAKFHNELCPWLPASNNFKSSPREKTKKSGKFSRK